MRISSSILSAGYRLPCPPAVSPPFANMSTGYLRIIINPAKKFGNLKRIKTGAVRGRLLTCPGRLPFHSTVIYPYYTLPYLSLLYYTILMHKARQLPV